MTQSLANRIAFIEKTRRELFPDVFFKAGRPLKVTVGYSARFIRLQLNARSSFTLASVQISDGRNRHINLAPNACVTTSADLINEMAAIEPHPLTVVRNRRSGIELPTQDAPWVVLDLGDVLPIGSVTVNNQPGRWASARAWTIQILTSSTGQDWNLIYDHQSRRDTLNEYLRAHPDPCGDYPAEVSTILDQLVMLAFASRFAEMSRLLNGAAIAESERVEIKGALSRGLLYDRKLEWTSHRIVRSFRFWSAEEKAAYLDEANQIVTALEERFPSTLAFGTVLGLVRNGDLIDHDDDVDVLTITPAATLTEGLNLITEHLTLKGFEVSGSGPSHRNVRLPGGRKVDVFVGMVDANHRISCHPAPPKAHAYSEVFPATVLNILGTKCLLPRMPENYLHAIYGETWHQPIAAWRHPKVKTTSEVRS